MASRITLYGKPNHPDVKRLKREMKVMYVEYDVRDPAEDARARQRLADELGAVPAVPIVEVKRADGDGSVFLVNPDEPTLRQSLYSEDILSITAYWV
ncbi:MAG: hypothetical protein JO250_21850 [Armatimonadetes bacterium]|nr:hypothetical protein [Armatimonadota bacterium]